MVPQIENFENISVNIYETDSCTKFDEGTQTQTFSMIQLNPVLRIRILNQTQ